MAGAHLPPTSAATQSLTLEDRSRASDHYIIAGVSIFLIIVIRCWTAYVTGHEMIYLLGSRRVFDPTFLATDITWTRLGPTSALFDHLLAPLWSFASAFTIVAIGRLVSWALFAWSLVLLARTLRLPAWSAVLGFTVWLLWKQTLAECGSPLEGFQLKAFSYPLMFFALALVIRGRTAWAGALAGLGAAFHIIVGGWGLLALVVAMLIDRRRYSLRQIAVFVLTAAPFVVPLVLTVARSQTANVSSADHARMAEIYVAFAMPHCCDLDYIMLPSRWVRAGLVFALAPIVIFTWRERGAARTVGAFVVTLIALFIGGEIAQRLRLYGVLELFPGQLANALPALFLFMLAPAWAAALGPARSLERIGRVVVILGALWLIYDRRVARELIATPRAFIVQLQSRPWPIPMVNEPLYAWIRTHTPRNSVFITPFLPDFWPYAERAQVATMRQPPLDRSIIEWKERLEALNGFKPYEGRGFETNPELDASEPRLSIEDLERIRARYGATHYLVQGERKDLAGRLIHSSNGYSVYELAGPR